MRELGERDEVIIRLNEEIIRLNGEIIRLKKVRGALLRAGGGFQKRGTEVIGGDEAYWYELMSREESVSRPLREGRNDRLEEV